MGSGGIIDDATEATLTGRVFGVGTISASAAEDLLRFAMLCNTSDKADGRGSRRKLGAAKREFHLLRLVFNTSCLDAMTVLSLVVIIRGLFG